MTTDEERLAAIRAGSDLAGFTIADGRFLLAMIDRMRARMAKLEAVADAARAVSDEVQGCEDWAQMISALDALDGGDHGG